MNTNRVGFWGIGAGCYGCLLSFIFNEDELLDLLKMVDLVAFPFIKEHNEEEVDLLFIEGTPVQNEDIELTKRLREKAKYVVALGACSATGGIPYYRNFVPEKSYRDLRFDRIEGLRDVKPEPIDAHIKVDFYLPGCPPDKEEIKNFIKDFVKGKRARAYKRPVCEECKLKENACLLEHNKICLGPATQGNCGAICPGFGFECWGCRGPTDDANFEELRSLLREKGFTDEQISLRLQSFAGKQFQDAENANNKA